MFTGLCAFPLSPLSNGTVDEPAFICLMDRLVSANVDSVCALGSTGNYAYLDFDQRARITRLATQYAGEIPVIIGIGALKTDDVLGYAEDAQEAGANGLLLPPMSYQPLQDEEVFALYETVARSIDIPLCVYDNPTTTHFKFSDELHGCIAQLPHVGSIKIPGVPNDPVEAAMRVENLRAKIPENVTIGVSGDAFGAKGLNAGCEAWYSAIGGLFPKATVAITRESQAGRFDQASHLSNELEPLWALCKKHRGSLRVIATAAELLGLVKPMSLPRPLHTLDNIGRRKLHDTLRALNLSY